MLEFKVWKGSNAFILLMEMGVVAAGVGGSVYTQTVIGKIFYTFMTLFTKIL